MATVKYNADGKVLQTLKDGSTNVGTWKWRENETQIEVTTKLFGKSTWRVIQDQYCNGMAFRGRTIRTTCGIHHQKIPTRAGHVQNCLVAGLISGALRNDRKTVEIDTFSLMATV